MRTLLILSSQPSFIAAIQVVLDSRAFQIVGKEHVAEAEILLSRGAIDATVLDISLTDTRAIRTIEELKRLAPSCPIIVYSSYRQAEWEEDAYLLGVDRVLEKPVRGRTLNLFLAPLLGKSPKTTSVCRFCDQPLPERVDRCPHCARPSLFPNVSDVEDAENMAALDARYQAVMDKAQIRGADQLLQRLETAANASEAVICRGLPELSRLAFSDHQLYATFYQKLESGIQLPQGEKWDKLRAVADSLLFGENRKLIRFGALTLNGIGLSHYGECSILLRTAMISHRSSLMEENSTVFMKRHAVTAADDYCLPLGHRSSWEHRGKLCVAKHGDTIEQETDLSTFPDTLLQQGLTPSDDKFVEVHIWGTLSIRSIRKVVVRQWTVHPSSAELAALRQKLTHYSVDFEIP